MKFLKTLNRLILLTSMVSITLLTINLEAIAFDQQGEKIDMPNMTKAEELRRERELINAAAEAERERLYGPKKTYVYASQDIQNLMDMMQALIKVMQQKKPIIEAIAPFTRLNTKVWDSNERGFKPYSQWKNLNLNGKNELYISGFSQFPGMGITIYFDFPIQSIHGDFLARQVTFEFGTEIERTEAKLIIPRNAWEEMLGVSQPSIRPDINERNDHITGLDFYYSQETNNGRAGFSLDYPYENRRWVYGEIFDPDYMNTTPVERIKITASGQ